MVLIPNLMVCSDSMHSKEKLRLMYPQVQKSDLEQLYDLHKDGSSRSVWDIRQDFRGLLRNDDRQNFELIFLKTLCQSLPHIFNIMRSDFQVQHKSVANINLTEFYTNTAPEYYLFHCTMETIDCTFSWKQIRTSRGTCLSLNVNEVYNKSLKYVHQQKYKKLSQESSRSGTDLSFARNFKDTVYDILERFEKFPARDEIKELSFVVGFNKSDNTLGWNGFNNALQLYYSDVHEKFESNEDSISVRVLTPFLISCL